jgi:hypothetical protein
VKIWPGATEWALAISIWLALIAVFWLALGNAQTPVTAVTATVPQLYVPFALPGDAVRKTGTVVIDPAFTLSRDPAGLAHLGMPVFIVDDPLLVYDVGGATHVGVTLPQIVCDAPLTCTQAPDGALHIGMAKP